MPDRFLVTGANGDIGEAVGRILREVYPEAQVEGSDLSGPWPARSVFHIVHRLPHAGSAGYIDALCALARRGFDAIVPTSEPEISRIVADAASVKALPLIMAAPKVVNTFLDKLDTARWLAANGFTPPRSMLLSEASASDLPLIVKPRRGAGGRGQEIVRTPARLALAKSERGEEAMAQQLLEVEDQEYTCAVLCFGTEVRTIVMRRQLAGDKTVKAEVVDVPAIDSMLRSLARAARPEGPLNVQLRMVAGGPKIFEINPRFSSTVMMRHQFGFRDVIWALERHKGIPIPAFCPPVGALAYRLAREVVVLPSADTVVRLAET